MSYFEEKDASRFLRKAIAHNVTFTADEIVELINFCDTATANILVQTAKCYFSQEQLDDMYGSVDDVILEEKSPLPPLRNESIDMSAYKSATYHSCTVPNSPPQKHGTGAFGGFLKGLIQLILIICTGGLLIIFFIIAELVKGSSKPSPKPHYGYRYGRWYYGTGHRYGCQDPSQDPHCRK